MDLLLVSPSPQCISEMGFQIFHREGKNVYAGWAFRCAHGYIMYQNRWVLRRLRDNSALVHPHLIYTPLLIPIVSKEVSKQIVSLVGMCRGY